MVAAQPRTEPAPITVASTLRALLLGALILPALAVPSDPLRPQLHPLGMLLAVAVAVAVGWCVRRLAVAGVDIDLVALAALAVTALLAPWLTDAIGVVVLAVVAGAALGMLVPRELRRDRRRHTLPALAAAALALATLAGGVVAASALVLIACAIAAIAFVRERRPRAGSAVVRMALFVAIALFAVVGAAWIGSLSPQAGWFGRLSSHGSRSVNEVAITFDDGPNSPYTERISAILDAHQVLGTFFAIGRSVREEPAVARSLIDRGHIVGNHTELHVRYSYLDPSYPELALAEQSYKEALGVCPALYRPPHGAHTPLTARVVGRAGMRTVTWDVEASDWDESDPQRLARNILNAVRPGSIILLHDGIDGSLGVDRSVVVQALPLILDGLGQRGLAVVGLDRLLGVAAYLPSC